MKAVGLILTVWVAGLLLLWVRGDERFSVFDVLPCVDRSLHLPPMYEAAALFVVAYTVWALTRRRG